MRRKASESAKGLIVDWGGVLTTSVRDSFEIWMFRAGIETRSFIVAMREVVCEARSAGWRTAILSNAWGMAYDGEDLRQIVDALLLSDVIGIRKPDPNAYIAAAEAIGVDPSDCIFVDDPRRNGAGAESVGMRGLLYRPGDERALRALLTLV